MLKNLQYNIHYMCVCKLLHTVIIVNNENIHTKNTEMLNFVLGNHKKVCIL